MSAAETPTRAQILKELRAERKETVQRSQEHLREQNAIRKKIKAAMGEEARIIPEIAKLSGLDTGMVLWHVTAMKKYGLVEEAGMDGEYYMYQVTKEKGQ